MATEAEQGVEARIPLSRARVLRAAVKIADERGIEALTYNISSLDKPSVRVRNQLLLAIQCQLADHDRDP